MTHGIRLPPGPFFFVGTNRRIYLFGNHLCGAIPPELGQLTKLVKLVLQQNHLSEEIPKELEGLNLGKTKEKGQTSRLTFCFCFLFCVNYGICLVWFFDVCFVKMKQQRLFGLVIETCPG